VLLLSLLLTPDQAAAATPTRYQNLHTAVRNLGTLIPEVQNANRTDQDEMLCLALNIYHEIRGGSTRHQWAVAFVTMNRTKRAVFNAKTICQVVWARGQFSWTVWNLRAQLPRERGAWAESQRKAALLVSGEKMNDPTNGSTHFYQARLNPGWARRLVSRIRIENHTFARLPGSN
jgi:spore germination cell wall hydrolase CwlJ-like protein